MDEMFMIAGRRVAGTGLGTAPLAFRDGTAPSVRAATPDDRTDLGPAAQGGDLRQGGSWTQPRVRCLRRWRHIPRCCCVLPVRSQDFTLTGKEKVAMPSSREAAEAQIRQQVNKIAEGIRARDLEGLQRLYTPDVVSFDVEPPLQHAGVAAKMKNWANVFAIFQDATYEVRDLTVTVGDDVAFGHGFGRLGGTLKNGAATSGMWVRATFCFQRVDGNWLIAHDQVSVPLDISSGKGVTDLEP
jgi:ketosteroid isomerase-like protein